MKLDLCVVTFLTRVSKVMIVYFGNSDKRIMEIKSLTRLNINELHAYYHSIFGLEKR